MQFATEEATTTLPESLFEQITPNLIVVLEHTQRSDSTATPEAKQAPLQAICRFASIPRLSPLI